MIWIKELTILFANKKSLFYRWKYVNRKFVLYLILKDSAYNIDWTDEIIIEIGLQVASGVIDKKDLKNYIEKRVKNKASSFC